MRALVFSPGGELVVADLVGGLSGVLLCNEFIDSHEVHLSELVLLNSGVVEAVLGDVLDELDVHDVNGGNNASEGDSGERSHLKNNYK